MGLNLFLAIAANIHFDSNILLFVILIWALEAAETAVLLYLFIVSGKCLGIINIRYRLRLPLFQLHLISFLRMKLNYVIQKESYLLDYMELELGSSNAYSKSR